MTKEQDANAPEIPEKMAMVHQSILNKVESLEVLNSSAQMFESIRECNSLSKSEPLLCLVLQHTADIVYLNHFGRDLLGITQAELNQMNWIESFILPEQHAELTLVFNQIMHGNVEPYFENYNEILSVDGASIPLKWNNFVITNQQDKVIGILCFAKDIRA